MDNIIYRSRLLQGMDENALSVGDQLARQQLMSSAAGSTLQSTNRASLVFWDCVETSQFRTDYPRENRPKTLYSEH